MLSRLIFVDLNKKHSEKRLGIRRAGLQQRLAAATLGELCRELGHLRFAPVAVFQP